MQRIVILHLCGLLHIMLLLTGTYERTQASRALCAQDKLHLYFLFDLMPGGDLMDVLVAEARVIKRRIAQGTWKRACFAPKVRPLCPPAQLRPGRHAMPLLGRSYGVWAREGVLHELWCIIREMQGPWVSGALQTDLREQLSGTEH